jgi:hypothetical protein
MDIHYNIYPPYGNNEDGYEYEGFTSILTNLKYFLVHRSETNTTDTLVTGKNGIKNEL